MQAQNRNVAEAPSAAPARPKILCVDDEPNVLASIELLLARDYEVHTANSGAEGLALLTKLGTVPVVVSDMRMPAMSGAQFLAEVSKRSPHGARVLLTGATDMAAAVEAINTGDLFRFLLKPCASDQLRSTIKAGVELHRLRTAEQDLLQRTLMGSVRALSEMLSMADPIAYGRIGRLKELAVSVAARMGIWETWPLEYATLVCQVGHIVLPDATVKKIYGGVALSAAEQLQVENALKLGPNVVKHIPRLEEVAKILEDLAAARVATKSAGVVGARILRTVLAYEALERTSRTRSIAVNTLVSRRMDYDSAVVDALLEVLGAFTRIDEESIEIDLAQLRPGMVTAAEIRSGTGALLVPSGTEIGVALVAKLNNFPRHQLPQRIVIQKASAAP